jgi:hypothetical protein
VVSEVGSGVGLVLSNRRHREPSRAGLGRSRRHRGRGRPRRLEAVASAASARPVRARRSADARRYIAAYDKEPDDLRLLLHSSWVPSRFGAPDARPSAVRTGNGLEPSRYIASPLRPPRDRQTPAPPRAQSCGWARHLFASRRVRFFTFH